MDICWQKLLAAQLFWLVTVQAFAEETNVPTDNYLIQFAQKRTGSICVTSAPFRMDDTTATMCARPPDIQQEEKHHLANPHRSKYVHVYVSPSGKAAMFATNSVDLPVSTAILRREREFPVGTIILKEKFSDAAGKNTELFTGMLKREIGFNPNCGDWEFFTLNSDASKVTSRGQLEKCMDCHIDYKKTDFVTKKYISHTR